jgi:hypothetical protein
MQLLAVVFLIVLPFLLGIFCWFVELETRLVAEEV